jgi:hypothetical protein
MKIIRAQKLSRLVLALLVPPGSNILRAQTAEDGFASAKVQPPSSPASPVGPESQENRGFFYRLGKAYWNDWKGVATDEADPPRRGYPAPVSSPPFPFSDWPYGGSPTIGTNGDERRPAAR